MTNTAIKAGDFYVRNTKEMCKQKDKVYKILAKDTAIKITLIAGNAFFYVDKFNNEKTMLRTDFFQEYKKAQNNK